MPLVRFVVKNEYGSGNPILYRAKKDCDPKAILDGVAVAGLVGILRQLGDLAELASDVFHDLHEQVMATSARGCKLSSRIQHIETELPMFENAIRGQRSHIHFAYVAGSDWHIDVKFEQSHLFSSDLPQFMLDSYEECRDPPCLHLLDRFDSAGTGACLKRYSDPSYFKRVWAMSELEKAEKIQRENKAPKIKRKGSYIKNAGQEAVSLSRHFSSACFVYPSINELSISSEAVPISATKQKPEIESRSSSFASRTRVDHAEQVHDTNSFVAQDELEDDWLPISNLQTNQSGSFSSDMRDKQNETAYSSSPHSSLKEEGSQQSPSVALDEKTEILKPTCPISCNDIPVDDTPYPKLQPACSEKSSNMEPEASTIRTLNQRNTISGITDVPEQFSGINHFDEMTRETENYMDALNTLESETETDSECQTKCELKSFLNSSYPQVMSGTSPIQEMTSQSSDLVSDGTLSGSRSFSNEDEFLNTCNFMPSESKEPVKPYHIIGSIPDPEYSVRNQISSGDPFDVPKMGSFEGDDHAHEYSISQMQERASSSFDFNGDDTSGGSQSSLNEDKCNYTYKSMASKILEHVKPPNSAESIPELNYSIGTQNYEGNSFDMSRMGSFEGVTSQPPEPCVCSSLTVSVPKTSATVSESPSLPPISIANVPSPKLWTNGSLLGLEPSKPPDFGNSNILNKDLATDSNISGYDHSSILGETILCSNGFAIDPDAVPSSNEIVSRYSKKTVGLPNASLNKSNLSDDQQFSKIDNVIPKFDPSQNGCGITVARGFGLPSSNSVESQSNDSGQSTMDIASSISALAQRILSNSLQRKQSITHAQYGEVNPNVSKQDNTFLITNQKERSTGVKSEACYSDNINKHVSTKSSILSSLHSCGHSSPPLEHMKISFHPMNGLETSRLKLEFATDSYHEGTEDLSFPSFQLLPRPNLSFENNGSETDDDGAFCRSYPSTSEEHFSLCSDSNSELGEQEDMCGENNHRMYDDLDQNSVSSSSVSSFKGFSHLSHKDPATGFENLEAENSLLCFQNSNSTAPHDLYSLISKNGEGTCHFQSIDSDIFVFQSQDELPPHPPLPPMQWRIAKASINKEEEKDSSVAEIVEHFNFLLVQRSTAHKQHEQDIPKPSPFPETLESPIKKPQNQESPNGKIELNHAANGKGFDAEEELLRQFTKIHDGQKLDEPREARHNDVGSKQLDGREKIQIRNKLLE